ncbi:PREDICTED: uncharacterized protein LOC109582063 [Amphimedon queenslandica]|uniref:Uncharacterized protein n=1 Tax=Amphimedon queenslandica TaxID=400682 RepID=A0AAN0J634_AMPQE|nr:PREDICTED: uncharacterized protein LOC109582063 [Amphimedon queenslandica]|eukprot:XP_019852212.1 PREDICTED: uncharacterized protein LOC109582063 [Amphimedon queenslandica]
MSKLLVHSVLAVSLSWTMMIQISLADTYCADNSRNETRSGHRFTVTCAGSSVSMSLIEEKTWRDVYIAIDYYCYHLGNLTEPFKSVQMVRLLKYGYIARELSWYYENLVSINSTCVFVGCVLSVDSQWYYMRGNGSNCTNEVHLKSAVNSPYLTNTDVYSSTKTTIIIGVSILTSVLLIISYFIVVICLKRKLLVNKPTEKNRDLKILVQPSKQLKISLSPSYTVYPPMNYKKNTTNSQETSVGRHGTTTTNDKLPHIDESSHTWPNSSSRDILIEYSEGMEGPWPAMYDIASTEHTSPTTTRDYNKDGTGL